MNDLLRNTAWDQLAKDMKIAVDKVYSPLKIGCVADKRHGFIDYFPPFYLEDNCTQMSFGVNEKCENGEIPKYPLKCTSGLHIGDFVVESKDDWENHTDKFVVWKTEIRELLYKTRNKIL